MPYISFTIVHDRIEALLRHEALAEDAVARSAEASAGRLHLAVEVMQG